jgi:hypothetical protein
VSFTTSTYDAPLPYDEAATYDGADETFQWQFTVPEVLVIPPYLPDTPVGPALLLFRHYTPRYQGVNVVILNDGTVRQDFATPENDNTAVPYPWDPYNLPPTPFSRVYDFHSVETDFHINPYIVQVFYGGHVPYLIDIPTYEILNAAGYADALELVPV